LARHKPPDAIARAFGSRIRNVREERGESLEVVSARVPGLSEKYLSELELGWHAPGLRMAQRLADALEVPLSELVRDLPRTP
jgi:transcriptional regulator with XRE-family HTH domain